MAQVAMVWRRSTRNPVSEKALEVRASGERNESFAHGKRLAVAKIWRDLREVFQNFIILLAEQIPLKRILIKSLITNQTET